MLEGEFCFLFFRDFAAWSRCKRFVRWRLINFFKYSSIQYEQKREKRLVIKQKRSRSRKCQHEKWMCRCLQQSLPFPNFKDGIVFAGDYDTTSTNPNIHNDVYIIKTLLRLHISDGVWIHFKRNDSLELFHSPLNLLMRATVYLR